MKQLIYIPNGEYMKFAANYTLISYGEFVNIRKDTWPNISHVLYDIKYGNCNWKEFIKRNNLPDPKYLTIEQFEVIEDGK